MRRFRNYFLRRFFGNGAQRSHSGGNLINHLLKAGLNRPPLSIPAEEPVSIVPSEQRRTGPGSISDTAVWRFAPPSRPSRPAPVESVAFGVGHPARATVFRLLSVFPASLLPFCAGVPAMGEGQPANQTAFGSSLFFAAAAAPALPRPSAFSGVGHPARRHACPNGSPAPFPLLCFALRRARRASCFSGLALSFIIRASGVGHPASCAATFKSRLCPPTDPPSA